MTRFAILLAAGVSALSMASAAQAADLIVHQPAAGIVETSSNSWDGAYIGVFGGYGWGTVTQADTDEVFTDDSLALSGWLVGLNAGANFTLGSGVVAGIVGDIAWSGIGGHDSSYNTSVDIDWVGSLRGRIGLDGGAFLPYLTGGLAVASATADYSGDADSQIHVGWTVGAGVELAVAENVSIDLLYRYSDYGARTYSINPDEALSLTTNTVTVGLNWKF